MSGAATTRAVHVRAAFTDAGVVAGARLTIGDDGRIAAIESSPTPASGDLVLDGYAIPGVPNVHGHAFQRVMAGHAERLATDRGDDSFWGWRETMYAVAERVGPDELAAIATWLQVEMLEAGYTGLGEFHYLHRSDEGRERALAMSSACLDAARGSGIRYVHLPVAYLHGGFGPRPLAERQRRFGHRDVADFLAFHEALAPLVAAVPDARLGVAPHSLRAVEPAELRELVTGVRERDPRAPVHVHVAEQTAEVEDCVARFGSRPVRLLLDDVGVDEHFCAIHATHLEDDEVRDLAASGAVVGLCPTTEANLGDGLFAAEAYLSASGRIALGSDSHVTIDPAEEMRLLEYGLRLTKRERCVLASRGGRAELRSVGRRLLDAVVADGRQALATGGPGGLAPGAVADFVVLAADDVGFAGHGTDTVLDAWVFGGVGRRAVRDVFVGGRHLVKAGRHVAHDAAERGYRAVCSRVFGSGAPLRA
jgi:formimidoylglutamate deiminase